MRASARNLSSADLPAEVVVPEFTALARNRGSPATTAAERVSGRRPASFAEWVGGHVDEFR